MNILYAHPYRRGSVQAVAKHLKTSDALAIDAAAWEMKDLVYPNALLVPVPGHTGDLTPNLLLCDALQRLSTGTMMILVGKERKTESQCDRHHRRVDRLTPDQLNIVRVRRCEIPDRPIQFVDNVACTGNTLMACYLAIGRGEGLVYAKVENVPS